MVSMSSDNYNLKLDSGTIVSSTVKKKLLALENILYYIKKVDNCEQKHLTKSKQKAIKLFSKIMKIIRNVETGKDENITNILDKKLPKKLMDLKTKSLVYHLEAIFVEKLIRSISQDDRSHMTKSTPRIAITRGTPSYPKNTRTSGNLQSGKNRLLTEIDNYVKYFLINIGTIEAQTTLIEGLVNECITMSEHSFYLKQASDKLISKSTIMGTSETPGTYTYSNGSRETANTNYFKQYSSQNNNSSESSKKSLLRNWKNCTTFLYSNNNNSKVDNTTSGPLCSGPSAYDPPSSKKRNIYVKIKDLKEKFENKINALQISSNNNKENIEDVKTMDECNLSWNDITFPHQPLCCHQLDRMNNETHSISDVGFLQERQLKDITSYSDHSNSLNKTNDSMCTSLEEMRRNNNQAVRTFVKFNLPRNLKCSRIINASIQSAKLTSGRADIALKFVNSTDERTISVKNLQNLSSYDTKSFLDGDNLTHYSIGIRFAIEPNKGCGAQHVSFALSSLTLQIFFIIS